MVPSGGSEGNVDISAVDISAIYYEGQGGAIIFPEGTTTQTVRVRIFADTIRERDETFAINLSDPVNAVLSNKTSGIVTMQNDD